MKMSDEERGYYDALASVEAWEYCLSVLAPWKDAAQAIGSEELVWCMEHAHEAAVAEYTCALDGLSQED